MSEHQLIKAAQQAFIDAYNTYWQQKRTVAVDLNGEEEWLIRAVTHAVASHVRAESAARIAALEAAQVSIEREVIGACIKEIKALYGFTYIQEAARSEIIEKLQEMSARAALKGGA